MVVVNAAKLMKETLLQKYIGEKQLLKSEQVIKDLTENMGSAFSAFADVSFVTLKNSHWLSQCTPGISPSPVCIIGTSFNTRVMHTLVYK